MRRLESLIIGAVLGIAVLGPNALVPSQGRYKVKKPRPGRVESMRRSDGDRREGKGRKRRGGHKHEGRKDRVGCGNRLL